MKYFQNVVDIVRDLMSPTAQEKHYKEGKSSTEDGGRGLCSSAGSGLCVPGMKKDADGFTDIDWCAAQPLTSWNDLRNQFMKVRT